VTKDVVEGVWSLVEFSGALPQDRVNALTMRVEKLQKAVLPAYSRACKERVLRIRVLLMGGQAT
jgi:hypothetical protein